MWRDINISKGGGGTTPGINGRLFFEGTAFLIHGILNYPNNQQRKMKNKTKKQADSDLKSQTWPLFKTHLWEVMHTTPASSQLSEAWER